MRWQFILLSNLFIHPLAKHYIETMEGQENIPKKGGFIVASNHNNSFDHYIINFPLRRRLDDIRFIGAIDEIKTKLTTPIFYYITDTIPLLRNNEESKKKAVETAIKHIKEGKILVIYPEGNFSFRDRLLKAKTGIAHMIFQSGAPVLPMGLRGKISDKKKRILKIGKPMYFKEEIQKAQNLDISSKEYYYLRRSVTDKIMEEISLLCSKPYPKNYE